MSEYILIIIFAAIVIAGLWLVYYYNRPRSSGLSRTQTRYYREQISRIGKSPSSSERIMSYDKVLAHILKDLGYEGSIADQLKQRPKEIHDINEAWRLHKIRNKLAHELTEMRESELKKEAKNFERFLLHIL